MIGFGPLFPPVTQCYGVKLYYKAEIFHEHWIKREHFEGNLHFTQDVSLTLIVCYYFLC